MTTAQSDAEHAPQTDDSADTDTRADDSADTDTRGDDSTDTAPATDDGPPDESASSDETVPEVELGLYQLSVRVRGRSSDDLDAVKNTARELVDHLVDRAQVLEESPDERGLG